MADDQDKALREQVGKRLRALREAQGLTQQALAERSGYTDKYVSEIEAGKRDVPLSTLRALLENGLGLDVGAVFERGKRLPSRSGRPKPADVDAIASAVGKLPGEVRRKLRALIDAMVKSSRGGAA